MGKVVDADIANVLKGNFNALATCEGGLHLVSMTVGNLSKFLRASIAFVQSSTSVSYVKLQRIDLCTKWQRSEVVPFAFRCEERVGSLVRLICVCCISFI